MGATAEPNPMSQFLHLNMLEAQDPGFSMRENSFRIGQMGKLPMGKTENYGIPSELLMVDAANYVNHLLQTLLQYRICSFLGSIIMLGICGLGLGMFWNKLWSPVLDPGSSLSWDFRCRWIPVDCFKHSLHSLLALGQSQ